MDVRPEAVATLPWDEPGWLDQATAWIDRHVDRTGDVEVVLSRPWSTVARVPTGDGEAWFKEDPPSLAFEPALTAALARRRPDLLPEVIAFEGPRLLTRDAGRRLRTQLDEGGPAPPWEELLAQYAQLQIDVAPDAEEAIAVGTLDARPEMLERLSAELPGHERRAAAVRRAVDGLGRMIPDTVVHSEAHDGNFFIRDGRVRLLDWAEAVVSHPFVGPVLTLRFAADRTGASPGSPEVERFRDAYLEPFTQFGPPAALRSAFEHGYLLGTLVRALTWNAVLAHHDPAVAAEHGDPVPAWLELFDGVAAGTITLGSGMKGAYVMNLGLVPYNEAWELQRSIAGAVSQGAIPDTILLLEHPPTVTTGRRTEASELHIPADAEVEVVETDRGGKSTYHGPGQLVCYPIFDLNRHGLDVKRYCRDLEEALVQTLAAFGVEGQRIEGLTGVWLTRAPAVPGAPLASVPRGDSALARPPEESAVQRRERSAEPGSARREPSAARGGGPPRKIASIGIHISKWITTHGYALNVDLDPAPFTQWITACGLEDAAFTTIAKELGRPVTVDEVRIPALAALAEVFELELEELPADSGHGLWPQPVHGQLADP